MPMQLPPKPMPPGDKAWIFSKTIIFLLIVYGAVLLSVGFSVWLGAMAMVTTNNRLIALAVGLTAYMSSMGGREWLVNFIGPRLLTRKDIIEMDREIARTNGDKRGPSDP